MLCRALRYHISHTATSSERKDARSSSTAEGNDSFDHFRVRSAPLERLRCSHAPANCTEDLAELEMLRDKLMLRLDVLPSYTPVNHRLPRKTISRETHIVDRGMGELAPRDIASHIRRRGALRIPKHGRNDNKVFLRIQARMVVRNEPFVILDPTRVYHHYQLHPRLCGARGGRTPGRINDERIRRVSPRLVRDERRRNHSAGLGCKVAEFVDLHSGHRERGIGGGKERRSCVFLVSSI